MLPENRFKPPCGAIWDKRCTDDVYIEEMLGKLPHAWRAGTCAKYSKVYLEDGRFEANRRLREMVAKFGV